MTQLSCMRIVEFDTGHRVHGHESKCARLHGHRYRAEIYARRRAGRLGGAQLDGIGRAIDFSALKEAIGKWLDEHWDHKTLLSEADEIFDGELHEGVEEAYGFVRVPFNPTAENMADYLLNTVCPLALKNPRVEVFKVVLWETPNCKAEATLG